MASARVSLGISLDEFWEATPAQIQAMYKVKGVEDYRSSHKWAMIVCYLHNQNASKKKDRIKPEDLIGDGEGLRGKRTKPVESVESIKAKFASLSRIYSDVSQNVNKSE